MAPNAQSEGGQVARRDRRHVGRRLLGWLPALLVLAVLATAFVGFEVDLGRRLGVAVADPEQPEEVAPPPGLELPALTRPAPVVGAADDTVVPAKVRRALARLAREKDLGKHRILAVAGPTGPPVFTAGDDAGTPASLMKLLTGTAALESLGPDTRLRTRVVAGSAPNQVVLVGGGDPYLTRTPADDDAWPQPADLRTLAKRTARTLKADGRTSVRLGFDDSRFDGPAVSPDWPDNYIPDSVVAPITALWVDQGSTVDGWGIVDDPAQQAARMFAAELRRAGITVRGTPERTGAVSGRELAQVASPPVWQIVEEVIAASDNEGAEVLAHLVGEKEGFSASFDGGVKGVTATLDRLGISTSGDRILDGSGLSRKNEVRASTILTVLQTAGSARRPELRPVVSGLPVAGFTGSMAGRLGDSDPAGPGRVRAKTGTLTGVHGLAGTTTDLDGNLLYFVFFADRVKVPKTLDARDTLDDLTAALAGCNCG